MLRLSMHHWPLVTLALPADLRRLDLTPLRESQQEVFDRRERYVSMTDATEVAHLPDAHSRREIGAFLNAVEEGTSRWQVANALILSSDVARRVLTAVHWLAPPKIPTGVFSTRAEAKAFLLEHAEAAGLSVDPIRAA